MSGGISCYILLLVCCVSLCSAQIADPVPDVNLRNQLSERMYNYSVEMLYHTSSTFQDGQNFIMSPITVWNVLAVISEGTSGETRKEINYAIRWNSRKDTAKRPALQNFTQELNFQNDDIELKKYSIMLVDSKHHLLDFNDVAKRDYGVDVVELNFTDNVRIAQVLNTAISNISHGFIKKIAEPDDFQNSAIVLTSALYFKGKWMVPFNASSTAKMPFFNSNGDQIGEVNMMNNKGPYAFAYIRELEAKVIEIPYGKEKRLSMVIMLPRRGVSVEDTLKNLKNTNVINMEQVFEQLQIARELYGDDDVECFMPRFKIETDLNLNNMLKSNFGIIQLFDPLRASLPFITRTPLYVSKIVQNAVIEVSEEGTTGASVTVSDFINRIGPGQFNANRPFSYLIVDKVTHSILFGGIYRQPSLY